MEYLLDQGMSSTSDVDSCGSMPLHYACKGGHQEAVHFLVSRGSDVLACNNQKQLPYDLCSNLAVRQYLLPLQLQAESSRGIAPVLPGADQLVECKCCCTHAAVSYDPSPRLVLGVTTAMSLGLETAPNTGPPPPPPPPSHSAMPTAGSQPPQATGIYPPRAWQPPMPDGFKSSPSSAPSPSTKGVPPPPPNPPAFNQYSAFNQSARQGLGSRYVTAPGFGVSAPHSSAPVYSPPPVHAPPQAFAPPTSAPFHSALNPDLSMHAAEAPPVYGVPPGVAPAPIVPGSAPLPFQPTAPASPSYGNDMLEEVSLSSSSSSVM